MRYRIVTNKSFEKYIDYISRGRRRKFEDRWDTLDLDDVTTTVDVPSEGEINSAMRELDLFDDVAEKTGAKDVEVGSDGKLRLLDLDDAVKSDNKSNGDDRDLRTLGLDLDMPTSGRGKRNSPTTTQVSQDKDDKVRELDLDEKGADVKQHKSNIGSIGALDYDSDVDVSSIAASIDDVYAALASSDPKIVKAIIKRYAGDITDENKIKEILLTHAVQLNYDSLRVMCGDMKVVLTKKEQNLGFIDRAEIKDALKRFRSCAVSLTGENNTYGLIPNVIVSCGKDDQLIGANMIDFLVTWCQLPVIPMYFRGAMTRKLYILADCLLDQLQNVFWSEDGSLNTGLLTGKNGLLSRIKSYSDIPKALLTKMVDQLLVRGNIKKVPSRIIGEFSIMCVNNGLTAQIVKYIKSIGVESNKGDMILKYIEDEDSATWDVLKKKLKLT